LTSFTSGGLGNRIRALLGGLALAKMQGRKFYYVWRVDKKFAASMTDLWDFKYPLSNEPLAKLKISKSPTKLLAHSGAIF
jgi:hypothetical protein